MRTIQKRADQLEPGDVIVMPAYPAPLVHTQQGERPPLVAPTFPPAPERLLVLRRAPPAPGVGLEYALFNFDCGNTLASIPTACVRRTFNPEQLLDVEVRAPELTPAQQHAERLADYAASYLQLIESGDAGNWDKSEAGYVELRDLVDLVKPPQAPTYAETLAALARIAADGSVGPALNDALALLDRARRANVMP